MPRTPSGPPSSGSSVRIVWHYRASDELRTFVVHYRLRGVAVAYDDVVDVNLQVWGSEWKEPLGRLTVTETAPGKILTRLGPPRVRARRRPARRPEGAPAGAERARRAVRRAPHRDPARGVPLDPGHEGRLRQRPPEDRRRGDGRRSPRSRRTASGSTMRSATRGGTPSTCSCSARSRRSSPSAASSGSTGGSSRPATTASTSRSRRRRRSPRSSRRCSGREARPARSSSPRRCST